MVEEVLGEVDVEAGPPVVGPVVVVAVVVTANLEEAMSVPETTTAATAIAIASLVWLRAGCGCITLRCVGVAARYIVLRFRAMLDQTVHCREAWIGSHRRWEDAPRELGEWVDVPIEAS